MRPHLLLSLLLLALATPLLADAGANNLIIPISGRTPGAFGTQWQTDLVITNLTTKDTSVTVTFYPVGRQHSFTTLPLRGYGTLELKDVIGTTMLTEGLGMLRVSSATPGVRLTARAYVYNRGSAAGEYGQGIPALPIDALEREHVLSGLVAGGSRRTNVGFANPWPTETQLIVEMLDGNGLWLNTIYPKVAARQVLQINDIFSAMEVVPSGPVSLRIRSGAGGIYPYASIVRNDTGDAVFVGGTGVAVTDGGLAATRCADPAAVVFAEPGRSAGDWIVLFDRTITNGSYVRNVIAPQHGVTTKHVYEDALLGFVADLTPAQIAALRCEPTAILVQENAFIPVP